MIYRSLERYSLQLPMILSSSALLVMHYRVMFSQRSTRSMWQVQVKLDYMFKLSKFIKELKLEIVDHTREWKISNLQIEMNFVKILYSVDLSQLHSSFKTVKIFSIPDNLHKEKCIFAEGKEPAIDKLHNSSLKIRVNVQLYIDNCFTV